MAKPIQFDPAKADELVAVFRTWLTGNAFEKCDARKQLKAACILVINVPNARFATAETHAPCKVFDANGMEWKHLKWCDLETGEAEQMIQVDGQWKFNSAGNLIETQIVKLATPVLVTPIVRYEKERH